MYVTSKELSVPMVRKQSCGSRWTEEAESFSVLQSSACLSLRDLRTVTIRALASGAGGGMSSSGFSMETFVLKSVFTCILFVVPGSELLVRICSLRDNTSPLTASVDLSVI